MERPYFPVFIDMTGRTVLIAGAGKIALRRVRTLLQFGACIRVVAPDICRELEEMEAEGKLRTECRAYQPGDAQGAALVIAATDSREANRQIWEDCRMAGVPVNVADDKELCDFYFPSVVMTEEAVVGISSGGNDPGKTKEIRRKIEKTLGQNGWYEM